MSDGGDGVVLKQKIFLLIARILSLSFFLSGGPVWGLMIWSYRITSICSVITSIYSVITCTSINMMIMMVRLWDNYMY